MSNRQSNKTQYGQRERELMKQSVNFVPIDSAYTEPGIVEEGWLTGIRLPDGSFQLNTVRHTSSATMALYRDMLKGEIIMVKGTWKFTPDEETLTVIKNPHLT